MCVPAPLRVYLQVYMSYGARPSAMMLFYNGFLPKTNTRDRARWVGHRSRQVKPVVPLSVVSGCTSLVRTAALLLRPIPRSRQRGLKTHAPSRALIASQGCKSSLRAWGCEQVQLSHFRPTAAHVLGTAVSDEDLVTALFCPSCFVPPSPIKHSSRVPFALQPSDPLYAKKVGAPCTSHGGVPPSCSL